MNYKCLRIGNCLTLFPLASKMAFVNAGATGGKGEKSVLPIRVNQAGMIPIIFAVSMVTFPSVMAQFFSSSQSATLQSIADFINKYLSSNNPSYFYIVVYFLLIIAFSYFYVSVTFNPENVAENIQKRGGFIPGIRPGSQTAEFLGKTSSHLNLFGGTFSRGFHRQCQLKYTILVFSLDPIFFNLSGELKGPGKTAI